MPASTDEQPTIELIVARCGEDPAWIGNVVPGIQITIYDKSPPADRLPQAIPLPNHGLEAHTYLHHICERYQSLSDTTIFMQGKPFDHTPSLHKRLRALIQGSESVDHFRWMGFMVDTEDRQSSNFRSWSKNPEGRSLDMMGFCQALWGDDGPETFPYHCGGQFAATSKLILEQPLSFYEKARDLTLTFPDAAHCFERTWDRVFGVRGVDTSTLNADGTRYDKPIRRLIDRRE